VNAKKGRRSARKSIVPNYLALYKFETKIVAALDVQLTEKKRSEHKEPFSIQTENGDSKD